MNQEPKSLQVSIYFALFSMIAAGMIGLGQSTWNPPLLVGFCCVLSIVYTDLLQWIVFPRWLVFIAMVSGAGLAIVGYLGEASGNQILAVGNLLIYVQLPLMFQKKSIRVYEQWGVFLLLELVVAALVNDNVLYGVLMMPVLAIGCAAMMALAQYASQLRHSESFSESTSVWARALHWLGKEKLVSKRSSGVMLYSVIPSTSNPKLKTYYFAPSRWISSILPIALAVLFFSVFYFYSLPRLNSSTYDSSLWSTTRIGFSDQISLRNIGDLLQNDSPAFRMSMFDNRKQTNYRPMNPPYIRMAVSTKYFDGPSRGTWQSGESISMGPRSARRLASGPALDGALDASTDSVTVNVNEKMSFGAFVPSIAPLSQISPFNDFRVNRRNWCIFDLSRAAREGDIKRRFSYVTNAFTNGFESALLPETEDCFPDSSSGNTDFEYSNYGVRDLVEFPLALEPILPLRDKILSEHGVLEGVKLIQAIVLEEYLASGTDFTYSLSLTRQVDRNVDPIVDFLLNKRKGHCQYYASSLALMLRSLDIPSRIVIGFRPSEYNELGQYFLVQQNHAHTWVEAFFTIDELKSRYPALPPWIKQGAWLRLDPTPPGDGSNAGRTLRKASGQTFDAMQDLWNELVLNMDKTKQSTLLSLYGESSSNSYSGIWSKLQSEIERLQSSRFGGGLLSPDHWFSWRIAVSITIIGISGMLFYRWLVWMFPKWMPRVRLRSSAVKKRTSKIDFYDRAERAIKRLGFERRGHETQHEFLGRTANELNDEPFHLGKEMLCRFFYARRFGGLAKLTDADQSKMDQLIHALESIGTMRRPRG